MNNAYVQLKTFAKHQRWQLRRLAAQRQYGRELSRSVPILFGNAMPKAGSHLMSQVMLGMVNLGPFVDTGFSTVNRDVVYRDVTNEQSIKNIQRLNPGDIAFGKMACKPPFVEALTQPGMATVFIYRDPRDWAISIVRYATDMHEGHLLHKHFNEALQTDEERLRFVINGSDDPSIPYSSLRQRYQDNIGWLDQPIFAMKFEDLILDRRNTLGSILDFIAEKGYTPAVTREEALAVLEKAIRPRKSGTFRKGTPGEWQSVFSPATKTLFKDATGDLLLRLGYEKNMDW